MPVIPIESLDDFHKITQDEKRPAVIDFWATWCGPCRMISPTLEKMSNDPAFEGVGFYKVDIDEQPDISQEVGIRAMPTFIIFKDGNKVDEVVGANPSALQTLVTKAASLN